MLESIKSMYCHVDMDAFYASAELLRHPELSGKPVVVGGGAGKRLGVVAASSYKARKFGIRSGTPISEAKKKCSTLVIIHPDFKYYDMLSEQVMTAIQDVSPDIQVLSIDEALVDISGVLKLWGSPMKAAALIKEKVKEVAGLPCTVGASRFPVLAKMASKLAKPDGLLVILPGFEKNFLLDHRISLIPGVGKATTRYYRYHGINTVSDMIKREPVKWEQLLLTQMPEQMFPKSVSASVTLDSDCENRQEVISTLEILCNKCGSKMRKKQVQANGIAVILRYSDFQTFVLPGKGDLLKYDNDIREEALKLFKKIDVLPLPVRLVGVRLFNFRRDSGNVPYFEGEKARKKAVVYHVMDRIRNKYKKNETIVYGKK